MFKYSVGPWNVHEGADAYGPATRGSFTFEEKIKRFKEIGIDADSIITKIEKRMEK